MNKQESPSIECLVTEEEIRHTIEQIKSVLSERRIGIRDIKVRIGPTVSTYKVFPEPGEKISKIKSLENNITMNLEKNGVRIVTLTDSVGVEVPNDNRSVVHLKSMLESDAFKYSHAELPLAIGYSSIVGNKVIDLTDAPHILLAGATKQGKTVCLHTMVASLLYSKRPDELKMVFIDPKNVEFGSYGKLLNHYLAVSPTSSSGGEEHANAIVTKTPDAAVVLEGLCAEMEARYDKLVDAKANNIKQYNGLDMPYIVCFVDEFADLTVPDSNKDLKALTRRIMTAIIRLAMKGRAVGIHMIIATQKLSTDVITGLIKVNFPSRIAFKTGSRIESTTILDMPGAERLINSGDMLLEQGVDLERLQGGYISKEEVDALVDAISQKGIGSPYYLPTHVESEKV